ncbi:MAG: hypothetical protein WD696_11935 [Bryobacteraceae bacterium]
MNRLDSMLERLPPIYRIEAGALLRDFLACQANHQAAYDEDMQRVQRSHWIDTALDAADLRAIGALFDIPMMPWEPADLYRTRLKATIAARLRGAVTRDVLEFVLIQILGGAQEALGTRYMPVSARVRFHSGPTDDPGRPAFVEFPLVDRRPSELAAKGGLLRPLDRFELVNRGLHPAPLRAVIRGVAGRLCTTPVLINLTNGQVLVYAGDVACGHELRLDVSTNGNLLATLNDVDVASRVYTGTGFVPGAQFTPAIPDPTPEPVMLERGTNTVWFFPLALFDFPSLGSGVLGMPDLKVRHGRFGGKSDEVFSGTYFEDSLFEQQPAASADIWWREARPASFRFEIPAGVTLRDARSGDAHQERLRLFDLLQQTVSTMRAAGVDGAVEARPLRESQGQKDRVRVLPAVVGQEEARMEDRLRALSALFDATAAEGSRFA